MKITALKKIYKPNNPVFLDYHFETLASFLITPRHETKKEEIPCWSPATFSNIPLKNDNVVGVSCAVFDIDDGAKWDTHHLFDRFQYIAHTSFSHTEKEHKWRLVIPFDVPVPSHLWEGAWMQCKRLFFETTGKTIDEKCKDARRFYFLGAKKNGYNVHVNPIGQTFSIDFEKCIQYKDEIKRQEKEKLERMKKRYNAIQNLPQYAQDPKESLWLKLSTDSSYRDELGRKIGGKNSGGANPRMIGWNCPSCGRDDATYYYIEPLGNKTTAQCGHLSSCGQWWTLFTLGRTFGAC